MVIKWSKGKTNASFQWILIYWKEATIRLILEAVSIPYVGVYGRGFVAQVCINIQEDHA